MIKTLIEYNEGKKNQHKTKPIKSNKPKISIHNIYIFYGQPIAQFSVQKQKNVKKKCMYEEQHISQKYLLYIFNIYIQCEKLFQFKKK